jgi:hypothetical protein
MTDLATIDLRQTDEPVKADQWKNLIFSKSGKSFPGYSTWPSEEAARDGLIAALEAANSPPIQRIPALPWHDHGLPGLVKWRDPQTGNIWYGLPLTDYSHTIQVPWKSP